MCRFVKNDLKEEKLTIHNFRLLGSLLWMYHCSLKARSESIIQEGAKYEALNTKIEIHKVGHLLVLKCVCTI